VWDGGKWRDGGRRRGRERKGEAERGKRGGREAEVRSNVYKTMTTMIPSGSNT
jgi:hypothetical protein